MKFLPRFALISVLFLSLAACSTRKPDPTNPVAWSEEPVSFKSGSNQLTGILVLPDTPSPHPAIVLISGSANEYTGLRPGIEDSYMMDQAHNMAGAGFAALCYNPPGVGQSTGNSRHESLDDRVQEAMAALNYLQTRTDIHPDRVGLWGVSQGGWIIAMAAADYPRDVAFIVSVSGSGVSVAEQQVWGVETQSRAAGLSESDVTKAVLFMRLFIDWQLSEPIYQQTNVTTVAQLGDGPWQDFMKLVYEPGTITPAESLQKVISILEEIQDEPWTTALYLKSVFLPSLRSIPPELVSRPKGNDLNGLLADPKYYLPRVTAPVIAFFGSADQLVPAQRSAELYELYLKQAGNKDFKIVVFPNVGHGLFGATDEYWKILYAWLGGLFNTRY